MKKIILIFVIIFHSLLFASNCFSQWIQQSSGTTNALYSVKFLNRNSGWIVGDYGTILKTTNGGNNWQSVPCPVGNKPLSMIHLVDSNVIYIVGWFETVLKSTNGGENWIIIRNGPWAQSDCYDAVFFINENTGWMCGSSPKVMKTTNGGVTLDSIYLFSAYMTDIYFKDANTGVMCCEGAVFKSTNGGINWLHVNIPLNGIYSTFRRISFVNNQTGWLAGNDGRIFKSTDFGSNWDSISFLISAYQDFAIEFINEHTGYITRYFNTFYKTTDGGYNWNTYLTGCIGGVSDLLFVDSLYGWGVATMGNVIHTTNGGLTFINKELVLNPQKFILNQNYPNPFNSSTIIEFEIKKSGDISIEIFDITGKKIDEIINGYYTNGKYSIKYNAENLNSGIYFYRLKTETMNLTKKFILIK